MTCGRNAMRNELLPTLDTVEFRVKSLTGRVDCFVLSTADTPNARAWGVREVRGHSWHFFPAAKEEPEPEPEPESGGGVRGGEAAGVLEEVLLGDLFALVSRREGWSEDQIRLIGTDARSWDHADLPLICCVRELEQGAVVTCDLNLASNRGGRGEAMAAWREQRAARGCRAVWCGSERRVTRDELPARPTAAPAAAAAAPHLQPDPEAKLVREVLEGTAAMGIRLERADAMELLRRHHNHVQDAISAAFG